MIAPSTTTGASGLLVPALRPRPRRVGLTMVIDAGLPLGAFTDLVESNGELIDIVKFGWGTALVTPRLEGKLALLRRHDIAYCFGGTLFEWAVLHGRTDEFVRFCRSSQCRMVEVSNGTIDMGAEEKARHVEELAGEFEVVSEVGFKDVSRAQELGAADWVSAIERDLHAGAEYVITEARESGRSGICTADGKPREEVVDAILAAGIDPARMMFEAPTKDLQTYFLRRLGPQVNLGNVQPGEVIALETLRLGLRSDTLLEVV